MTTARIPSTDEAWEDETLGGDPEHMKVASDEIESAVEEASETHIISIRMQKSMVEAFKAIAAANKGIGYQTLMKQILQRFIDGEMRRVWQEHLIEQAAASKAAKQKQREKKAA